MNFYNFNLDYFVAMELILEQYSTSTVGAVIKLLPFRIFREWRSTDKTRKMIEYASTGLLSIFVFILIRDMRKKGYKVVLSNFWNFIELSLAGVVVAKYIVRVYFDNLKEVENLNFFVDDFVDLMDVAEVYQIFLKLDAFAAFLGIIKLFKYFNISKSISLIWMTLEQAKPFLYSFFFIYILLFLSFGLMSYIIFSQSLSSYRTYTNSLKSLISGVLGFFSFWDLQEADEVMGPIFFLLYIVPMFFVLSTIFLSIILERYVDLVTTYQKAGEKDEIFYIISSFFQLIRYFFLMPIKLVLQIVTYPCKYLFRKLRDRRIRYLQAKYDKEIAEIQRKKEMELKFLKGEGLKIWGRELGLDEIDEFKKYKEAQELERKNKKLRIY